jgi:hypothetical protein
LKTPVGQETFDLTFNLLPRGTSLVEESIRYSLLVRKLRRERMLIAGGDDILWYHFDVNPVLAINKYNTKVQNI